MARLPELRGLRSLGFQSKLLIMLLGVSVISVLIAGILGYVSGTNSLRNAEYERLVQLRESRDREITSYFDSVGNAATVLTHSNATITAMKDFTGAFAELEKTPLPPGAKEAAPPNARRFLIDFAGGDLPFFLTDPSAVEVVATASNGRILRAFITPNPHVKGFRAGLDVQLEPGQTADLRVSLRNGSRALTETWTMPFTAE